MSAGWLVRVIACIQRLSKEHINKQTNKRLLGEHFLQQRVSFCRVESLRFWFSFERFEKCLVGSGANALFSDWSHFFVVNARLAHHHWLKGGEIVVGGALLEAASWLDGEKVFRILADVQNAVIQQLNFTTTTVTTEKQQLNFIFLWVTFVENLNSAFNIL